MEQSQPTVKSEFLPLALLLAASVLVFLPSLPYEMLEWDDDYYILQNMWLLNLSWANVQGIFTTYYFSNYHPLTLLSYMIDFQLWGYDPAGYRLVNILLHAATVLSAYGLFRTLGAGRWVSAALLVFFAVHPLRLESVVWISERKDVLSGFFYVAGLWLWSLAGKDHKPGWPLIVASFAALVLSLLSKAMAVSFPFVIALHDFLLVREKFNRRIPLYLAMAMIAALFMVINVQAQAGAIASEEVGPGLLTRLGIAAYAPFFYLSKTLVPLGLSPLYPIEFHPTQNIALSILGFLVSGGALALVALCWNRAPLFAWGLLSTALILGPVSGIISFGAAFAADRYSYLPTIVLFAGLAPGASQWMESLEPKMRRAYAAVGALLIMVTGGLTLAIMPAWQNTASLWERVLDVYPQSAKAQTNRLFTEENREVSERAQDAEAIITQFDRLTAAGEFAVQAALENENYDRALALAETMSEPGYTEYWKMRTEQTRGDMEAALPHARDVLALDTPYYLLQHRAAAAFILLVNGFKDQALAELETHTMPTPAAHATWGELSLRAESPEEKIKYARRALEIHPAQPVAIRELAGMLRHLERLGEAKGELRAAAYHPIVDEETRRYAVAMLGKIAEDEGRTEQAEERYAEAFTLDIPENSDPEQWADTFQYLAFQAELIGQFPHAYRMYSRAVELVPAHPDATIGLALLDAMRGQRKKAATALQNALAVHPENQDLQQALDQIRAENSDPEIIEESEKN